MQSYKNIILIIVFILTIFVGVKLFVKDGKTKEIGNDGNICGLKLQQSFDLYIRNLSNTDGNKKNVYWGSDEIFRIYEDFEEVLSKFEDHITKIMEKCDISTPLKKNEVYNCIIISERLNGLRINEALLNCVWLTEIQKTEVGTNPDLNMRHWHMEEYPAANVLTAKNKIGVKSAIIKFINSGKFAKITEIGKINIVHLWRRMFPDNDAVLKNLEDQIKTMRGKGEFKQNIVYLEEFKSMVEKTPRDAPDIGD